MGKRRRGKLPYALKHRFKNVLILTLCRVEFYLGIGAGVRRQVMAKNRNARVDHMAISKFRKFPSSVMSSQNALQTVVVVMNWSPPFRSTYITR